MARGKDFAVERTKMKPDLAVTEVALGHHSPCPAQRDVPIPVPVPVPVPAMQRGCNLAAAAPCRVGTEGGTIAGVCKHLFEPLPISVRFLGLPPLHRTRMQAGQPPCLGGWGLHPCLEVVVNIMACVHMWYEDLGTSYKECLGCLLYYYYY